SCVPPSIAGESFQHVECLQFHELGRIDFPLETADGDAVHQAQPQPVPPLRPSDQFFTAASTASLPVSPLIRWQCWNSRSRTSPFVPPRAATCAAEITIRSPFSVRRLRATTSRRTPTQSLALSLMLA